MKRLAVLISLIVIIIASSWALFHPSFFRVHDYVHAARISEMTAALQEGHFPVRWTRNFGYGYGMPLFEFYAPLPFYIGSLFYWLGVPIVLTVKIIFLLSSVLTAIGAYVLGSKLFGKMSGILVAGAITLAPYRAVNLYVRGAIGEAWGIMAMPWVLLGIVKVIRNEKNGWVMLLASLVTLMLSHNIMTMMFVPCSILFGALYLLFHTNMNRKENPLKKIGILAGSYLLSVGMSAFYMFPALAENKYTQVHKILGGYFDYTQHFLYIRQFFLDRWAYDGSEWGPNDKISFFLGWGQLLGILLAVGLVVFRIFAYLKEKQPVKKIFGDRVVVAATIAGLLLGLSLYMTLLKSLPIWQAFPPLSVSQFPWRFMGPGIVFAGLLVGASAALVPAKHQLKWAVICLVVMLTNARYFQPKEFLSNPDDFYYTDPVRIRTQMSSILPDYIPLSLKSHAKIPLTRITCGDFEHTFEETCEGKVDILVDRGHEVLLRTNFIQETRKINVAIANFPGWKIELDGQPVETVTESEWGNIALVVPQGEHLIGAYFGSTPVRFWSDVASLASLIIVVFILLPSHRQPAKLRKHD